MVGEEVHPRLEEYFITDIVYNGWNVWGEKQSDFWPVLLLFLNHLWTTHLFIACMGADLSTCHPCWATGGKLLQESRWKKLQSLIEHLVGAHGWMG